MSAPWREAEQRLAREIAEQLRESGYRVMIEPAEQQLPFHLRGYKPDLLAMRNDGGLIIEIKRSERRLALDRYAEVAEVVKQHPGWRFILIPADRLLESKFFYALSPLAWDDLVSYARDANRLIEVNLFVPAFLTAWSGLEGLLRRQGDERAIPITSLSAAALIKHLYSFGVLSMDQFRELENLLLVRNAIVHGFETHDLDGRARRLLATYRQLLDQWHPPQVTSSK